MTKPLVYLVPAAGKKVRDPDSLLPLKPEGEEKALDSYWTRRINDGDVVQIAKPESAAAGETTHTHAHAVEDAHESKAEGRKARK